MQIKVTQTFSWQLIHTQIHRINAMLFDRSLRHQVPAVSTCRHMSYPQSDVRCIHPVCMYVSLSHNIREVNVPILFAVF